MKISILMSFFNAEPFLTPCIESIIAQSEPYWELIAVNNFATDHSAKTISEFARRDNRIILLENTREGIVPALQMALSHSTGQLITRMDADDLMPPDKLALMKQTLIKSGPKHLVTGLVRYFAHEGKVGGGFLRYAEWLNELTRKNAHFSEVYRECVIPSPAWMCFRQDLLDAQAFQPEVYPEDYDLCFRFYRNQIKVLGIPHLLHHWRDYPTRTSRTDERYANPSFFELKTCWFLKTDYSPARPLVLWGAGPKGKQLAKHLIKSGVPFHWLTGNAAKHGKNIYGTILQSETELDTLKRPQILLAVSSPPDIAEIEDRLLQKGFQKGKDLFPFC